MALVKEMVEEYLEQSGFNDATLDEESVSRLVSLDREISSTGAKSIGILVGEVSRLDDYSGSMYVVIFNEQEHYDSSEFESLNRRVDFIFTPDQCCAH